MHARAARSFRKAGQLSGNVEADGSGVRKCAVSFNNSNFHSEVAAWQKVHGKAKLPPWLVLHVRVAGAVERPGGGKAMLALLPHRLVRPGAVPPTESLSDVRASGLLQRLNPKTTFVFTDGNRSWASECKRLKLKHQHVNHSRMQFVKMVRACKGQSPLAGTQKIDRLWRSLKTWLGPSLNTKDRNKAFNERLESYVDAFQYRYNSEDLWKDTAELCRRVR